MSMDWPLPMHWTAECGVSANGQSITTRQSECDVSAINYLYNHSTICVIEYSVDRTSAR